MSTATKKDWKQALKNRMKEHRAECLECLYDDTGYAWDNVKRTLKLMNTLLQDIPADVWPDKGPSDDSWNWPQVIVRSGNWHITLSISDKGKRLADLKYNRDDHSAWVVERPRAKQKWGNYDIGGS